MVVQFFGEVWEWWIGRSLVIMEQHSCDHIKQHLIDHFIVIHIDWKEVNRRCASICMCHHVRHVPHAPHLHCFTWLISPSSKVTHSQLQQNRASPPGTISHLLFVVFSNLTWKKAAFRSPVHQFTSSPVLRYPLKYVRRTSNRMSSGF